MTHWAPRRPSLGLASLLAVIVSLLFAAPIHAESAVAEPPYKAELMALTLPDDADERAVWAYLQRLSALTANQMPHEPLKRSDPQQAMLEALAESHMALLLTAHDDLPTLRFYLRPIVREALAIRDGPDRKALAGLVTPSGEDAQAIRRFLDELERLTQNQKRLGRDDPQVRLMTALGHRNPAALIDAMHRPALRYHGRIAIRQVIDQQHRDLVLSRLLEQPRLISVVIAQGWVEDARGLIVQGLIEGRPKAPWVWTSALVRLEDPETYPALRVQLVRSRGSRAYYELMEDLPGIDLDEPIAQAWRLVAQQPLHVHELQTVSLIAVRHGHQPALRVLIDALPTGDDEAADHNQRRLRERVLEHIEPQLSNDGIKAWLDDAEAEEALDFNPQTRRFYVSTGVY
ncbi:MAG: hypothetical protein AAF750_05445 [Planctomycetota bacterium]